MRKLLYVIPVFFAAAFMVSCASSRRVILDSSSYQPSWTDETRLTWEEDGKVFIRTVHTIRGNERLNGCFTLAKLDARESLLSEIATDVRGSIDNAQQSISEDAEVVLGSVRTSEISGRITGLRFTEQYFERYTLGDNQPQRIDCHLLGQISKEDYNRTKRRVVSKVVEADPRLKEAILRKQIDFFDEGRSPASSPRE